MTIITRRFEDSHEMMTNIFFFHTPIVLRERGTVDRGISRFRVQDLVNGNHDRSSDAIKDRRKRATCPHPLWSADCTLC